MKWDPQQYGRYADERGRPFRDLLAQVGAADPRHVVDLGCGPGNLTALLAQRWPSARAEGLDSSPDMVATARNATRDTAIHFEVGDVRAWEPAADVDVVVTNAVLQWVPGHRELVLRWADALPAGGWLALQVPGNFDAPAHELLRQLSESPRWRDRLSGVPRLADAVLTPRQYAATLAAAGLVPDVWETTYLHRLTGDDAVLEWMRGTGLRPLLAALPEAEVPAFEAEYRALLRAAYPVEDGVATYEFRRVFAVGHRA